MTNQEFVKLPRRRIDKGLFFDDKGQEVSGQFVEQYPRMLDEADFTYALLTSAVKYLEKFCPPPEQNAHLGVFEYIDILGIISETKDLIRKVEGNQ
jgi:hypothetical protein